jgi:hypothetical protein
MARIYPDPPLTAFTSAAEERLYHLFKTDLPGSYTVLHSVRWLQRRERFDEEGEADFIVLHPSYGGLILEVKGGGIRRDPLTSVWYSKDRHGDIHPIKDPFQQAARSRRGLLGYLNHSSLAPRLPDLFKFAVAFPDVTISPDDLAPDAPRSLILDANDLMSLERSLLRAWRPSRDPLLGPEGVRELVGLLSPAIELTRMNLSAAIAVEREQLIRLTEQQMRLLDLIASHHRVAVRGVAGSGKSLLALETARRQAALGKRVLFTCFNQALADWARVSLASQLGDRMSVVYVDNYHDLAEDFARRAAIRLPGQQEIDAASGPYYNEVLPQFLSDALATVDQRFDAIVVDEAQDFADIWWLTIESLLADPEESVFYLFYDPSQIVYTGRSTAGMPIPEPHFRLDQNCRNTRAIHDLAFRYSGSAASSRCEGPEGRTVEVAATEPGRELDGVRRAIHTLLHDEGIELDQIVVLTPRSSHRSVLQENARIGNLTLTWNERGPNQVKVTSIARFKGLESDVVILAELDQAYHETRDALLHVGISRAKHHAVIVGQLPEPGGIQQQR